MAASDAVPEGSVVIESVFQQDGFDRSYGVPVVASWRDVAVELTPAPPKAGVGSGRDEWAAHAEVIGVPVPEDATRKDIIAAVENKESE